MKKVFSILLATVIMLMCIPTLTSCGGDFEFYKTTVNGEECYVIVGCKDTSVTEAVIPSTHKNKPVREIRGAFFGCENLVSVTIPDSITGICCDAFGECKALKSITLPESVTLIQSNAFLSCTSLESINIPDSVTEIGQFAFNGCTSLKSITIGAGVTEIGYDAFNGCSSLTGITFVNTENWIIDERAVPSSSIATPEDALEYYNKFGGTWKLKTAE